MKCTSPLPAYRLANGDVVFVERGDVFDYVELACGKCLSCRINRSEDWATRIMHEAKTHDFTSFLTLTYSDEKLPNPPSLNHKHFQDFMKRLRRYHAKTDKRSSIRFFMCGEYGSTTFRPHYHAAVFGTCFLSDRTPAGGSRDRVLYHSQTLDDLWQLGYCTIGELTRESAAYIARYIIQKKFISFFSPSEIKDHYKRLDLNTGEIKDLEPEYIRMSLKPGIGGAYYVKYGGDIYPADNVIIDGQPRKVPRYYDKLKAREDKDLIERVKMARHQRAKEHVDDNSNEMLAMQDEWLRHSMKTTKQRPL